MSEADELFLELGFKKVKDTDTEVQYDYNSLILGDKLTQTILIAKVGKIIFSYESESKERMGIGIKELQAINKKVEELGWI